MVSAHVLFLSYLHDLSHVLYVPLLHTGILHISFVAHRMSAGSVSFMLVH
jgi:hypothetical protein